MNQSEELKVGDLVRVTIRGRVSWVGDLSVRVGPIGSANTAHIVWRRGEDTVIEKLREPLPTKPGSIVADGLGRLYMRTRDATYEQQGGTWMDETGDRWLGQALPPSVKELEK